MPAACEALEPLLVVQLREDMGEDHEEHEVDDMGKDVVTLGHVQEWRTNTTSLLLERPEQATRRRDLIDGEIERR